MINNIDKLIREKITNYSLIQYEANTPLLNLGIDSMDFMRLMVDLEDELGIEFPLDALSDYKKITPNILIEIVLKKFNT